MKVPLHAIANGRAGDKGDTSNISVIAYDAAGWSAIREQVSEARVLQAFRPLGASRVTRHELPRLQALNFVVETALDGGVNRSLGVDRHGKTLSFLLLGEIEVEVDEAVLPAHSPYRTEENR